MAVDTHILVRYAVKDDPQQTVTAPNFLATHQCFVLKTVLLELVWVLGSKSGYGLSKPEVLERVRHILGVSTIHMQDSKHAALALTWYEAGMDFADALHLASSLDVQGFATFEKKIQKKALALQIPHNITLLPGK
ncbi:MAG: type II toxin-antitoxin system VapC family toxin [bacterium]|nr:type II toxin-antitoxin system VapC family toxin [bacterium]